MEGTFVLRDVQQCRAQGGRSQLILGLVQLAPLRFAYGQPDDERNNESRDAQGQKCGSPAVLVGHATCYRRSEPGSQACSQGKDGQGHWALSRRELVGEYGSGWRSSTGIADSNT